jgi:hypothetical protein
MGSSCSSPDDARVLVLDRDDVDHAEPFAGGEVDLVA